MIEKIYQTITIKGSNEKFIVDTVEYPFTQLNTLYIKFIVYKKRNGEMVPQEFLIVQPQDILTRIYKWSWKHEGDLIIEASNIATKQRMDYQKAEVVI
jgi:hypothetical protein